ncbi:MAG: hypothetical protein MOB07_07745 [Acidobacteria bacterium]|nr:hypothetical protein [Acidobacteriota bacterium]
MRSKSTIFREEALEYHFRGSRTQGDLLRLCPRWVNWTYWLLMAVLVAGSIYALFGRVNEYATGAAVIRDEGRTIVTAITGGTIEDDALSVIAILPGHYRPLLKPGLPLRLELTGFRYAYQRLTIDAVGNEVIGPNEVRRFLGQEIADSLALHGSSVIVQAHLPSRKFNAHGRWHEYHDGMTATAEARLRSENILLALVPGLRAVFGGRDE